LDLNTFRRFIWCCAFWLVSLSLVLQCWVVPSIYTSYFPHDRCSLASNTLTCVLWSDPHLWRYRMNFLNFLQIFVDFRMLLLIYLYHWCIGERKVKLSFLILSFCKSIHSKVPLQTFFTQKLFYPCFVPEVLFAQNILKFMFRKLFIRTKCWSSYDGL
jgi:hypothetical protein